MFSDTSPEAEKVQIELLRQATNAQRLAMALSLTDLAIRLARRAIARANPGLSQQELDLIYLDVHYGRELADRVRDYLKDRAQWPRILWRPCCRWFRLGDAISERQWRDAVGVLKVQKDRLDRSYLAQWAADLGLTDLLQRAWREAEG
jgi:hypothetical protein